MKGYEKEKSGDMGFKMHVIIFLIYLEKTINLKKFRWVHSFTNWWRDE